MTAPWNRWMESIAGALDASERECVLGDIAELRMSGVQATASLLGLVLRRRLDLRRQWKWWLILFGCTMPAVFLLGRLADDMAGMQSIYLWLYLNNWTATYLETGWLRSELFLQIVSLVLSWLVLAGWAWTGGFVLASVARATMSLDAALFAILLFRPAGPHPFGGSHLLLQTRYGGNAAVFAGVFYRVVYPFLLQVFLVLFPVREGARHARQGFHLSCSSKRILWMSISLAGVSLLGATSVAGQVRRLFSLRVPCPATLVLFSIAAPMTYFVLSRYRLANEPVPTSSAP